MLKRDLSSMEKKNRQPGGFFDRMRKGIKRGRVPSWFPKPAQNPPYKVGIIHLGYLRGVRSMKRIPPKRENPGNTLFIS